MKTLPTTTLALACLIFSLVNCAPKYVAVRQNLDSKPSIKIAYVLSDYNEFVSATGTGGYRVNRFPDDKEGKFTLLGKTIQETLRTQWPEVKTSFNDRVIMFTPGDYLVFNLETDDERLAQMGQVKDADLVLFYSVAGNGRPVEGGKTSVSYSQTGTQVNPGTQGGIAVSLYGIVSFVDPKTSRVLGTYRAGLLQKNIGGVNEIGSLAPELDAAFRTELSSLLDKIKSAKE